MNELWKALPGFEDKYLVSNLGNIKHVNSKKLRILCKDKAGYLRVTLRSESSKQITCKVHRVVAIAFINNFNNYPEVNHVDGVKSNNKVENLEWSNRSKNIQHSFNIGLQISLKGEQIGNSKLVKDQVLEIRKLIELGYTQNFIADKFGIDQAHVWRIKERRTWKHI